MAGPAPREQEIVTRTTNKVVHLPSEEKSWTGNVAQHAEKATGHPFTPEQATPPAAQPIPTSKSGPQIQPGINAEPVIDTEHFLDIMEKTGGNVIKTVRGEEGLLAHEETVPGRKFTSKLKEMVRRKLNLKKAA